MGESVFINLRNNKLKELPNEVGQWVKLERLYLGCNQLQGIPQEFGSLTSLVELEPRDPERPAGSGGTPPVQKQARVAAARTRLPDEMSHHVLQHEQPAHASRRDRKLRESGGVVPVQERKVFVVSRASWPAQGVERASGEAVSGAQIAAKLGVRLG